VHSECAGGQLQAAEVPWQIFWHRMLPASAAQTQQDGEELVSQAFLYQVKEAHCANSSKCELKTALIEIRTEDSTDRNQN
jgi:hypothetical protein